MTNPHAPSHIQFLEELTKAQQSLEFAEQDILQALKRCHGPFSVSGIPLAELLKTTVESKNTINHLKLLVEQQLNSNG